MADDDGPDTMHVEIVPPEYIRAQGRSQRVLEARIFQGNSRHPVTHAMGIIKKITNPYSLYA
jgi:hypothetical protein